MSEGTAESNPKRRACEPEFGNGTETMFPDGYPYLLTTEASRLLSTVGATAVVWLRSASGAEGLFAYTPGTPWKAVVA